MRHLQAAPNSVEQSLPSQQLPPGPTLPIGISAGQEKGVSPAVVVVVLATVVVSGGGATVVVTVVGGATVVVTGSLHFGVKSLTSSSVTTSSALQIKPAQHINVSVPHSSPTLLQVSPPVVVVVATVVVDSGGGATVVVSGESLQATHSGNGSLSVKDNPPQVLGSLPSQV